MSQPFAYQRGEPITVDLVIKDAGALNPATLIVEMKLKPALLNGPPDKSVSATATLGVTYTAPVNNESGFWRGTTSDPINPGTYVLDAQIFSSGGAVI